MPFVRDPGKMWETWLASRSLRIRPSDYLGIEWSVTRYYMDKAVWTLGSLIDADLAEAEDSGGSKITASQIRVKKQAVLDKWLIINKDSSSVKGRFKDPAVGRFSKGVSSDR